MGRKLVLNMVMVGFVTALTGLATPAAVRKAIADSVPKGTENLNLAAFEKGLEYGKSLRARELTARVRQVEGFVTRARESPHLPPDCSNAQITIPLAPLGERGRGEGVPKRRSLTATRAPLLD